ncbi:MAG: glycosyltransferase [Rhodospirillales bacterium]|nr:glycosyltransferase [Rhodospirillales bacterium]
MNNNYKHVILLCQNKNVYGSILRFLADLQIAFEAIGLSTEWRKVGPEDLHLAVEAQAKMTAEGKPAFFFDVNGRIGTSHAPRFTWVVDHPLTHPQLGQLSPKSVLGFIDESHVGLEGYVANKHRIFLPHGGPPLNPNRLKMKDRKIPILFCGHVFLNPTTENFKLAFQGSSHPLPEAAMRAFERITIKKEQSATAILESLFEYGISPSDLGRDGLAKYFNKIENFSQAYERLEILQELEGCSVNVIGSFADEVLERLPADVNYLGEKNYDEFVDLMGQSRIVLNTTRKFSQGSHERIWYGMANGAMILTSQSSYMESYFKLGEGVISYDPLYEKGSICEQVKTLLESPEIMDEQVATGAKIYTAHHLWENRAKVILEAMNQS